MQPSHLDGTDRSRSFPDRIRRLARLFVLVLAVLAALPAFAPAPHADDHLSGSDIALIGAGSVSLLITGRVTATFDSSEDSHWSSPLPGERRLQRLLGGSYYPDKSNLFDRRLGGAITPAFGFGAVITADLGWPGTARGKDLAQDLYLYATGLMAVEGVTGLVKGLVRRERPMLALEPALAARRTRSDYGYDRRSFFSGHTSAAFFAMTFANKRVRSVMRREMTPGRYRDWRWLPPTVAFGWASLVGWSRINAWDHYVSDVAAGALVGWLMAELFYEFGDRSESDISAGSGSPVFISIRIPL